MVRDHSIKINTAGEDLSDKAKALIASEVEKQLAGKFADLLKEIEARIDPKTLARAVSIELGDVRIGGRRLEHK